MTFKKKVLEKLKKYDVSKYPKNDIHAWKLYPEFIIMYDKFFVCNIQGIQCGPISVEPKEYPVIVKPVFNLHGMGNEAEKINNKQEFDNLGNDSRFWSRYHEGEHISWDVLVRKGKPVYFQCWKGIKQEGRLGTFDRWEYIGEKEPNKHILKILKFFTGTGTLNLETIGEYVIEMHLRPGDVDMVSQEVLYPYALNYLTDDDTEVEKAIATARKKNHDSIYLIPVWQYNTRDLEYVYNRLYDEYEEKIMANKDIDFYYFDSPMQCSPPGTKRWFLFRTTRFEKVYQLKKEIEKFIQKISQSLTKN